MHKLLRRQIERAWRGDGPPDEAAWRRIVESVSEAYEQADVDRRLLERSLELASGEMIERLAALRHDASLLGSTLESTVDGIVVTDPNGAISVFNEHYLELWGFDRQTVRALAFEERLAKALALVCEPESLRAWIRDVVASPLGRSSITFERIDGTILECETRPQLLDGTAVGRVWCFRDITLRHRAEEALRRSEERSRALIENISDVITITDTEGAYSFVSPSVARVLGHSPEELIGRRVADFIHPEDRARIEETISALARTGKAVRCEFRYLHKDGSWRILESLRVDARGLVGVDGFLGVARDVTEKRRLESEALAHRDAAWRRERLSALGTLVAGVAHEINNPLTYIAGNLELAELMLVDIETREPAAAEVREQVQTALKGAERIGRIARALKTVARQSPSAARQSIDLGDVARSVVELARVGIPDHIELAIEADAEARVVGEASQLHQVVLNLTKNAIEAMGVSPGRVTLAVRRDGAFAEVLVRDDGPGIPHDVQARLFTPFFTTKSEGTGLGLSIVHSIVKAHEGEIHIQSQPGRGSTFVVRLPASS